MAAERKSTKEQYELICECRASGLTDYQWCREHNINPGTFYNWVKRLRKKACYDIPAPIGRLDHSPAPTQDIVKLEIIEEPDVNPVMDVPKEIPFQKPQPAVSQPSVVINVGTASILLQNDIASELLDRILRFTGELVC